MKRAAGDQAGFVLPAVLWLVALLALATTGLLLFLGRVQDDVRRLQQVASAELQLSDARQTVLHMLATQGFSPRGLEIVPLAQLRAQARPYDPALGVPPQESYVALDDRAYRMQDGTLVRLQDARGLLDVNYGVPEDLARMLQQAGVEPERATGLVAALQDYADTDDMARPGGAEAAEYRDQGLAGPLNLSLRTPEEVRLVLGWNRLGPLLDGDLLLPFLSSRTVPGLNVNNAPVEVLRASGFFPAQIEAILQQRRQGGFTTTAELQAAVAADGTLNQLRYVLFPADQLRVTIFAGARAQQLQVSLTPGGPDAPWRIDYVRALPSSAPYGAPTEARPLVFPDPAPAVPAN